MPRRAASGDGRRSARQYASYRRNRNVTQASHLPDLSNLNTIALSGLENLHSRLLADCSDADFVPSEKCLVPIESEDHGRDIVRTLHDELKSHLEKVLADEPEKEHAAPAGKKRKTAKPKPAPEANKQETTVAKKASASKKTTKTPTKKTPAKKAAPKNGAAKPRAKFDDDAKITWIRKDEGTGAREGSGRDERRKLLRKFSGKTVGGFLKSGGLTATLANAVKDQTIRVG